MSPAGSHPRLLLVGGTGGLAGRAVAAVFRPKWTIRSVHRHPVDSEAGAGFEWVAGDAATIANWAPLLRDVDAVVNLAWYRQARGRRFRALSEGLVRLVRSSEDSGVRRWVQLSVPPAPPSLESGLPYLRWKRAVDDALIGSRLSYSVVRASMLFGARDKLLTVMLRTMARYHRFPMFGDGEYHLSPIAASDVARILLREVELERSHVVDAGGPTRWRYCDLTDAMFRALARPPRYVRFSPTGAVRLARLLESLGSSRLYAYEVEWLMSDLLGSEPYAGLEPPLNEVDPFLRQEAGLLRRPSRPNPAP